MTEQTNVETQPGDAGAGGTTTPPASSQPGASVAVDAKTLSKLVKDAIAEELKPVKGEISGLYSRQDKDRNALREFMDEVKKQQANGLSENDAIDAAQNALNERAETAQEKKMLKEIHAKLFGLSSTQDAGNVASGAADMANVISELKLDANSADVVAILAKGLDPDKQELELRRYAARPKTQPSAAESATLQGGAPATKKDAAPMIARLAELQKVPSKNFAEIEKLEKELDAINWGG